MLMNVVHAARGIETGLLLVRCDNIKTIVHIITVSTANLQRATWKSAVDFGVGFVIDIPFAEK